MFVYPKLAVIVDLAIFAASGIGLAVSLLLSFVGAFRFTGELVGNFALLNKWLLFSFVFVTCAFVLRYQGLTANVSQKMAMDLMYRGCPTWMRYSCYTCMGIGAALFFTPGILEVFNAVPKAAENHIPSTVPGGMGMMLYSSLIAQLYSARKMYGPDFLVPTRFTDGQTK